MALLQTICINGSDRDYAPERIAKALMKVACGKQGNLSPSEYSEQVITNYEVLTEVCKCDIFGNIPPLQQEVVKNNMNGKLNFKFAELAVQSPEVIAMVKAESSQLMFGCLMTLNSHKSGNLYSETKRMEVAGGPGSHAFARNRVEAVDKMDRYKNLKIIPGISFHGVKTSNGDDLDGDTSSAAVLVQVSEAVSANNDKRNKISAPVKEKTKFACFQCDSPDHSQYKCPELTKVERQARYLENHPVRTSNNNIDRAVHMNYGEQVAGIDDGSFDSASAEDTSGNEAEASSLADENEEDNWCFLQAVEQDSICESSLAVDDADHNELTITDQDAGTQNQDILESHSHCFIQVVESQDANGTTTIVDAEMSAPPVREAAAPNQRNISFVNAPAEERPDAIAAEFSRYTAGMNEGI